MDDTFPFSNGTIDEFSLILIEQLTNLSNNLKWDDVIRLPKALCGMKNALKAWNFTWSNLICRLGLERLKPGTSVYIGG